MLLTATSAAAPANRAPVWKGEIADVAGSGYYSQLYVRSTGERVGRAAGYGSLDEALRSLGALTRGAKRPGAGIFESGGRYYGQSLSHWAKYDDQLGIEKGPWHFEGSQDPIGMDGLEGTFDPDLRAFVDGTTVVDVQKLRT